MQHPVSGRPWVAFGFAVALTLAVVIMARADAVAGRPVFGLATIALAAALAVLATTIGLAGLLAGRREEPLAEAGVRGSWSHVVRLGVVLLFVVGTAIVVRAVLVPEGYGRYGYYRGDAAREAMFAAVPRHVGRTMCAGCHTREGSLIAKDVHGGIECEGCHGPGSDHVASLRPGDPANREHVALFIPQTQEPCLWCHRRLAARPSAFPQIDPAEHFRFLGVSDPQTPCMRCHNPHEPLFLDRPLREARMHPLIQQCRDCHADAVAAEAPRPDNHPVVFECRYCHSEVAADFAGRSHVSLGCSRCHPYHRESDTAGRIVKNRDPRFCLLCHRRNPFRGPDAAPLIDWPAHREQLAPGNESVDCVDCHLDRIHRHTADLRPAAARGAP